MKKPLCTTVHGLYDFGIPHSFVQLVAKWLVWRIPLVCCHSLVAMPLVGSIHKGATLLLFNFALWHWVYAVQWSLCVELSLVPCTFEACMLVITSNGGSSVNQQTVKDHQTKNCPELPECTLWVGMPVWLLPSWPQYSLPTGTAHSLP